MSKPSFALSAWQRLSGMPGGKWAFSRLVCAKAPFFSSISPLFEELGPGRAVISIKKRRKVLNHIGTVHAIAMCNMAELAGGTMTDVTIPTTHRWIPKGMTVQYLLKAETNLRAVAELDPATPFGDRMDLVVPVKVLNTRDEVVFRADITMLVTAKKK
jgi:acyl-coenzyme A thioesterase PaaI-like protein